MTQTKDCSAFDWAAAEAIVEENIAIRNVDMAIRVANKALARDTLMGEFSTKEGRNWLDVTHWGKWGKDHFH